MRIGLINIEPKIFNTAYMQMARYHKDQGDTVDWWSPLTDRRFDKIYCSSIFDFTDKGEVPKRAICGGTGFDVKSRLLEEIEHTDLDYSIYPNCNRSFIWFSRGCIRNCPWCIVPEKEGKIHSVLQKNLNPNGRYIVIQDNNFFANPEWQVAIDWLCAWNRPVDIQGVDVRLLDEQKCRALLTLKHYKQIKIAWEDPRDHKEVLAGIKRMIKHISPYRLMCYVLIGYWHNQQDMDLYRVEKLRALGIDPFVMPFDKNDLYQRAFARWVNHKAIFKKVKWQDYKYRVSQQELAGTGWKGMQRG